MNPKRRPRLSFGLPVRNGKRFVSRAIESIRSQTWNDWELVVSDNASSDGTAAVVEQHVAQDSRVRLIRNECDIGQIENFNLVFRLSRGKYFRWIGADDYLEPDYSTCCIETLEARPEAVGVTTLWRLMDDNGNIEFRRYTGQRIDDPDPSRRFRRALRFLQADPLVFDPIYSLIRRSALERTQLLPLNRWTDRLLAVELALLGPFVHVDQLLATRRNAREHAAVRLRRFHSSYRDAHLAEDSPRVGSVWTMYLSIAKHVAGMNLPTMLRGRCLAALPPYCFYAQGLAAWRRGSRIVQRRLLIRP